MLGLFHQLKRTICDHFDQAIVQLQQPAGEAGMGFQNAGKLRCKPFLVSVGDGLHSFSVAFVNMTRLTEDSLQASDNRGITVDVLQRANGLGVAPGVGVVRCHLTLAGS
ncbi:MAG: hypothetical protein HOP09_00650 [Hyphomicrobium sp.]|nr:hypothetical protein [Hyphomicrobium sp.]